MNLVIPFFIRFLHWSVVGILTTVMTLLILSKGLGLAEVGLVVASFSAVVILLEFPSGVLSDRLGRRTVYLLSIGVAIAASATLIFAGGFWSVTLGFCLFGVARALSSGSIESDFIDRHIECHGQAALPGLMTVMGVGETVGLATGALLGGLMPLWWTTLMPGAGRYEGNLWLQIAILLVLGVLTLVTSPPGRPAATGAGDGGLRAHLRETFAVVGKTRILALILGGAALWGIALNAVELFWQPQLRTILGGESQTWVFGLVNSGYFVAALVGTLVAGALLSRAGLPPVALVIAGRLMTGGLLAVLAFQMQLGPFAIVYLLMFLGNGIGSLPESTLYNAHVPSERRASLLSLLSLVVQLGGVIGSLAWSRLVGPVGIAGLGLAAGIILAVSGALFLLVRPAPAGRTE